jgi:hypothetical protein
MQRFSQNVVPGSALLCWLLLSDLNVRSCSDLKVWHVRPLTSPKLGCRRRWICTVDRRPFPSQPQPFFFAVVLCSCCMAYHSKAQHSESQTCKGSAACRRARYQDQNRPEPSSLSGPSGPSDHIADIAEVACARLRKSWTTPNGLCNHGTQRLSQVVWFRDI